MKYVFLPSLLFVIACGQPPSESTTDNATTTASMDEDDFVEACLEGTNWERLLCECAEAKAKEQLSDDGYAFQIAAFREDDAETTKLRERMSFEEITQAGMFMVNASRECAEEGG